MLVDGIPYKVINLKVDDLYLNDMFKGYRLARIALNVESSEFLFRVYDESGSYPVTGYGTPEVDSRRRPQMVTVPYNEEPAYMDTGQ
jgi:hypothetical protein